MGMAMIANHTVNFNRKKVLLFITTRFASVKLTKIPQENNRFPKSSPTEPYQAPWGLNDGKN